MAQLIARAVWDREVEGLSPFTPTKIKYSALMSDILFCVRAEERNEVERYPFAHSNNTLLAFYDLLGNNRKTPRVVSDPRAIPDIASTIKCCLTNSVEIIIRIAVVTKNHDQLFLVSIK